jgi:hypothetical protein
VELAGKAAEMTHWRDASVLDTLAAAEAENGNFEAAVRWQKKVLELNSDSESRQGMEARLNLFQENKAYREERKGK